MCRDNAPLTLARSDLPGTVKGDEAQRRDAASDKEDYPGNNRDNACDLSIGEVMVKERPRIAANKFDKESRDAGKHQISGEHNRRRAHAF